nr:hypothetical protein [uncultured Acetatifactor sp.]
MINTLIGAISRTLNAEFGDNYECYMEEIKQDLKEPCFFIQCLNPTEELFIGKKYFRQNQFCIQYFPESKSGPNAECHSVAERLLYCLKWLPVKDSLVMGRKIHYEVTEGILHFFVNYDMFVYKVAESPPVMEEVSAETLVRG